MLDTDTLDTPGTPQHRLGRFATLLGASAPMRKLHDVLKRVSPTSTTVFISGESGSGKELVANTIHQSSARAHEPFVAVNCSGIPASLIEAELFGYEKGSFTGAERQHKGYFERAGAGTLFLDEITEMPVGLQAILLRVLESRRFVRVGGTSEIEFRARVIAATNQSPAAAVKDKKLREDLLYRLSVFPVAVPPLRERGDDIVLLAERFLDALNRETGLMKRLPQDKTPLTRHLWPGNVRELRNLIQQAYILADEVLDFDALMDDLPAGLNQSMRPCLSIAVGTRLADAEKEIVQATLKQFKGNRRRTAEVLGISLKTLYNRLAEYNGNRARDLESATALAGGHSTSNVYPGPWQRMPLN